ncbi:MAG TPA: HD domain-containing protein [Chthoniobacteraceae bacterium]|nr:HD domain-containing protein [Chthoniobacteraceae bacterium]
MKIAKSSAAGLGWDMVHLLSINALRAAAQASRTSARVHGQIYSLVQKETQQRKPYWEMVLADAETRFTLRAWNDSPTFRQCAELAQGGFVEVTGEFEASPNFGLDAKTWVCRALEPDEIEALLAGPPALREKQAADYAYIQENVAAIGDPRLKAVCTVFLEELGERFRRTAGARNNHHARRGGLVEHTAQMMRAAIALCGVYSFLNRDLLTAGVLLHDSGKMWENVLPADGFVMPYDERGEMMGHISIGMELTNRLWRQLEKQPGYDEWKKMTPRVDDLRLHLTHLILSHHGELQFGSPVAPKTPEAFALHYIDNLDAKMEMATLAYQNAGKLGPRVYEKVWPLPANLFEPLPKWTDPKSESES